MACSNSKPQSDRLLGGWGRAASIEPFAHGLRPLFDTWGGKLGPCILSYALKIRTVHAQLPRRLRAKYQRKNQGAMQRLRFPLVFAFLLSQPQLVYAGQLGIGRTAVNICSLRRFPDPTRCMDPPCVARENREAGVFVLHQCIRPRVGACAPGHHGIRARPTD